MRPPLGPRPPGASRLSASRSSARVGSSQLPQQQHTAVGVSMAPNRMTSHAAPPSIAAPDIRAPWASASLLFNFEEWSAAQPDDDDGPFRADEGAAAAAAPLAELPPLPRPAAPLTSYEARLEADAAAAVAADPRAAAADPAVLALALRRAGHDAFVRRALGNAGKRRPPVNGASGGSGSGGEGAAAAGPVAVAPLRSRAIFETLSHAFVVVRPQDSPETDSPSLLVVDAAFRDAVAVVSPPPRLARVLDALPAVFVGDAAKLDAAVRLVAAETRAVLEAAGRPLPPWRSARALLSKWMPQGRGAVADERPSEDEAGVGCPPSPSSAPSSAAAASAAAASGLTPPTSPACAAAGCCSPFSDSRGGGIAFSTSPEGPFASSSSSAVPPTALGGGGNGLKSAATPPIALVAPPLVARLSVSLLSISLARVSASASSAAASAAKATAAAVDEMRPVRRAAWGPAPAS